MPRTVNTLRMTAAAGAVLLALAGCDRFQSADSLVADAKAYQQKGDNKAALIQLRNAAAKRPEDGNVRLALGMLYNHIGDALSAEKELRKAISLGAGGDTAKVELLRALLASENFKAVLAATDQLDAKTSGVTFALRGEALLATNARAEGRAAFERALAADPKQADALMGMGRYWLAEGKPEQAQLAADQAVAAAPENAEAWMFQAMMRRGARQFEPALAAYDKALQLRPDHRTAHLEKAYTYTIMRKFDLATGEIAAGAKSTPGSIHINYAQALLASAQNKYADTVDALQKVLKVAPDHLPSMALIGAAELKLGSYQSAEQHLKKYNEQVPRNLSVLKLLASAQIKLNHPDAAAATLAAALKTDIADPDLWTLAGQAELQAGNFKRAADNFEKASKLAPHTALLHTALGMSRLVLGDQAAGIGEMELATSIDSSSTQAGVALVSSQIRLRHYDKALAAVNALEKQQPKDAMVHSLKGGVYQLMGDSANARGSFEKAQALAPDYFAPVANLARLDAAADQPEAARKRLEAFLASNPNSVAAMNALVEIAIKQQRVTDATALLERAAAIDPNAAAPAVHLAAQYLSIGEKQKALSLARNAQTANPANPDVLEMLGQAQAVNDDLPAALESFNKLAAVLPKSAEAQYRLATIHLAMKNDVAALAELKRAVALQPDFANAYLAMADIAMRRSEPDQVVAIARQIQKNNPKSALGFTVEGDLLMTQKKPEAAVKLYEQAHAIAPGSMTIMKVHKGMLATGRGKEAGPRLAQWLRQHPDDLPTVLYAAQVSMDEKDYRKAAELLQTVLKHEPNNVLALNNLAWTYHQTNNPEALPMAERAFKLAAASAPVADTLGAILVDQGKTERGVGLLRQAVAQAPTLLDARYHLAIGLHKMGDDNGARTELEAILASGRAFAEIDDVRGLRKQLK